LKGNARQTATIGEVAAPSCAVTTARAAMVHAGKGSEGQVHKARRIVRRGTARGKTAAVVTEEAVIAGAGHHRRLLRLHWS